MAQSENNQVVKSSSKRPHKKGRPRKGPGGRRAGAGAPKGNTSAVKTGERQSVFDDMFTDEEAAVWARIDTEKRAQLESEIRLLTMREYRMLQRIRELKAKGEFSLYERSSETHTDTTEDRSSEGTQVGAAKISVTVKTVETKRATVERIQAIEDALTRVQNSKAKALELLIKLESDQPPSTGDTVQRLLDALDGKVAEVWADEPEPDEAEQEAET